MIAPRIIPRDQVLGAIRVEQAKPDEPTCRRTIELDGRVYDCRRKVRSFDRQHDGIHDAFVEHQGGAVRW